MRIALGDHAAVVGFVSQLLPLCQWDAESTRSIGVIDDDGTLVAGVLYHGWEPHAGVIEMSAAAVDSRWLARPILQAIFAYPFDGAGCQMVVLRVSERNERMCRICRAFGFGEVRVPRLLGRDEAAVIFTLTDDAWRAGRFYRGNRHE